ncbi:MAG TPA: hypothetical protein VGK96_28460 [Candidatus Sulfotelmatobacter sp.]|jgi:hypothetical protein
MTELEWLKQESGLTDDELKAMEAVAGHTKFVGMLQKMIGSNEAAAADKKAAEQSRLDLEKRYQDEFIPEMRKVTQDSLRAQGELARAQAELKAAKEYGIVPESTNVTPAEPVRAPGSPDPNALSKADLERYSAQSSRAIISLNDLNAEHFKLYGSPLPDSQGLVDEVTRQHTLGHKDYTLKKAWETKYNVEAKRAETAAAERQKDIDTAVAAKLKEERQKHGDNPHTRTGVPSRFSTYKPSDAAGSTKPWQTAPGMRKAANEPWRKSAISKLSEVA